MILPAVLTVIRISLGRKFNKDGEVVEDWWSNSSSFGFKERSKCIVDQYSQYKVDIGGGIQENVRHNEAIIYLS